jgi:hypothetical protein
MSDPDKPRYRRVVRRHRSADPKRPSMRPAELWAMLKSYFGFGRVAPLERIDSPEALGGFIDTRSSFMAQTSLYGYLRTRAGMRYPELFDDDPFVEAINIAKWHVWLDCLSDITVYAGSRVAQQAPRENLAHRPADVRAGGRDSRQARARRRRPAPSIPRTSSGCASGWRESTGWLSAATRRHSPRARPGWCAGRR